MNKWCPVHVTCQSFLVFRLGAFELCLLAIGLVLVLVCYATTQLALQLQQERIQVLRSNTVIRRID